MKNYLLFYYYGTTVRYGTVELELELELERLIIVQQY